MNPGIDPTQMFISPPDSRKPIIAKITTTGPAQIAFLPVDINVASEPQTRADDGPRFAAVGAYVRRITTEQGLQTRFIIEGAEVMVAGA